MFRAICSKIVRKRAFSPCLSISLTHIARQLISRKHKRPKGFAYFCNSLFTLIKYICVYLYRHKVYNNFIIDIYRRLDRKMNDPGISLSDWIDPNSRMEGIRIMEPLSNANYLHHSNNVALNMDGQNVVPVGNISHKSPASSSNSVGQVYLDNGSMNTHGCSLTVPLQQLSHACHKDEFLKHLTQKQDQMQKAQQLNAASMHQPVRKPLRKNVLENHILPPNDFEREQLALNNHKCSASHQPVVLQSGVYRSKEQQIKVGQHLHSFHTAQAPDFTPSLQADAVKEGSLDSTHHDQHPYVNDWIIETYMQIQMLREKYLPEVELIYKMADDLSNQHPSVESSTRYQKRQNLVKMIIKVLAFTEADLVRHTSSRDKVRHYLKNIEWHLSALRLKRLGAIHSTEQPHPPGDNSLASQLNQNRKMEVISNQLHQGLPNQHSCSPQSSTEQGVLCSQENFKNSLCGDLTVENALSSYQNSPSSLMQRYPPNQALQTNIVALPNIDSPNGLEHGSLSSVRHSLGKSTPNNILSSQQENLLPSKDANLLVPTMSSLKYSANNSSHVLNQEPKNQMALIAKMKQPIQKSKFEKSKQQMLVQKRNSLHQQKSNIQPEGYYPQLLTSSLPDDHEKQFLCAESTVHLQTPPIPVEQYRPTNRNGAPSGSSSKTSASPLSVEFDTPEVSLQLQPFKRLIKVVKSMSSKDLYASLQDLNAIGNLLDNTAGSTCIKIGYPILEKNSHNKVTRQLSVVAHDSLSGVSGGTNFASWCGQAADIVSTRAHMMKKRKIEKNRDILGEIRAINLQLIETWLDVDLRFPEGAAGAGGSDGTIIKCSYTAVGTVAKSLRMQYASSQMLPDFIVRWYLPADYPNSSPMLLDTLPGRWSETKHMSEKLESKLNRSIRTISQPMSLEEMVKNWDACARAVFMEFAEERNRESLRSNLGTWETCIPTL